MLASGWILIDDSQYVAYIFLRTVLAGPLEAEYQIDNSNPTIAKRAILPCPEIEGGSFCGGHLRGTQSGVVPSKAHLLLQFLD